MAVVKAPYDEFWYLPLVERKYQNFVYVVYWPDSGIIKAGVTFNPGRWRKFCRRGAILLAVIPGAGVRIEKTLEDEFALSGVRAFSSWEEATPWLGAGGCGYTECYRVDEDDMHRLASFIREVDSALVQD